jgi:hypothetical protein
MFVSNCIFAETLPQEIHIATIPFVLNLILEHYSNGVTVPGRDHRYSVLHSIHTSFAATQLFPYMLNSRYVKLVGYSPLSNAEIMNAQSCASTPPYIKER